MVPQATVLLGVVLIGYGLLSRSNYYKERVLGLPNYAILYESTIVGALLFFVAWFAVAGVKAIALPCAFRDILFASSCWIERDFPLPHVDVLAASAIFALLLGFVDNRIHSSRDVGIALARERGWMENFILDAVNGHYAVQITTIRRKVYIGWLQEGAGGIPADGVIDDIGIVPLYSGYRNRLTLSVEIDAKFSTTVNERILNLPESQRRDRQIINSVVEDMVVVIPINEIALMRRHTRLTNPVNRLRD